MPGEDAGAARASPGRIVQVLAAAAVAVQVLPIWLTTRFPDQDGPADLASSVAISGAYHGAAATGLHAYVTLHLDLGHNPLGHLILAGLIRTTGVLTGQRLFLTGFLVLFALAGWYAMSAVRERSGALVTVLLPVGSGYFLLLGFWDFLLSLVGVLVVTGYWLRHHDDNGRSKYAVVAGLLLVTSLLHPSGLVVGLPVVGLVAVIDACTAGRRAVGVDAGWVGVGWAALAWVPACVPAVLVAANASGSTPRPPLSTTLRGLFGLASVVRVLHSRTETGLTILLLLTLVVLVTCAVLSRWSARAFTATDAVLVVALGCGIGSLLAPGATGGAEILNERLAVFAVVMLVIWLGAQELPGSIRIGAAAMGAVLAIGFVAIRIPKYRELDRDLREIASVGHTMVPGRTFVLVLGQDTGEVDRIESGMRMEPLRSAGGYFAAEHDLVGLDNYEGRYGYFPYQYVASRDPVRQLFLETNPRAFTRRPQLDLAGYTQRTGGVVDYVAVLGPPDPALKAELASGYRVIAVSKPAGLVTLFARRVVTCRPSYWISPNASVYETAVIERPSSISPSRTIRRTSSTGTHSIRSDSPGSVGSPTCVAPSAMNVWKT